MPRYYFDIYNDLDTIDEDGSEFADLDAAIASAIRGARSIAADHVMHGRLTRHDRIEILDCDRKLLRTIRFDEAVTISP